MKSPFAYGLTLEQYEELAKTQKGLCLACLKAGLLLYVDHSHATGKIRGLLCRKCNLALDMVEDNPDVLRALAAYLDKHADESPASTGKAIISDLDVNQTVGGSNPNRGASLSATSILCLSVNGG